MNNIGKYLKIARDVLIKPSDNIEQKIIDRISNIDKNDEGLLDEKFLDFFRKSNSRFYLVFEKFKNSQGVFVTLAVTIIFIIFIIFLVKKTSDGEEKGERNPGLSSSKKKA
ncbi:MAG: hypothetical protein AVO38_00050 [delta proteobacterium ML8_D]|jgi:uncharacterized membrane protein|nr:MAG: hypothetical protein AVO38_00050 [delta proteobacterium ML8_D]